MNIAAQIGAAMESAKPAAATVSHLAAEWAHLFVTDTGVRVALEMLACDDEGNAVDPLDDGAEQFCLVGGVIRIADEACGMRIDADGNVDLDSYVEMLDDEDVTEYTSAEYLGHLGADYQSLLVLWDAVNGAGGGSFRNDRFESAADVRDSVNRVQEHAAGVASRLASEQ